MLKLTPVRAALAALTLSTAASCNIPLTSDYIYPMSIATPGDPISDEIRTAAPGELLFSQRIAHAGFVRLDNTVHPADRVWQGVVTFFPRMEEGLVLYPALRVGKARGYVACSVEAVTSHQGGLGPAGNAPVCLDVPDTAITVVRPGDPAPDNATAIGGSLWLRDGAQATTGFVYWTGGGEQAQGSEGSNFTLTEPARLSVAAEQDEAGSPTAIRVGLRYVVEQDGARLETVYITGEQQLRIQRAPVPIAPGDVYPRTVETGGAVIELLAVRDGVLAYRVRQNFPSDRYLISNLPG